jgi:hypothetical protein
VRGLGNGFLDRPSNVFLGSFSVFPARDLFDKREPAARKAYLYLTPEPRASGL